MKLLSSLDQRVESVRVFFYNQYDKFHKYWGDKNGGISVQYNSERGRHVETESNKVLLRGEEFIDRFLSLDLTTKLKLLGEKKEDDKPAKYPLV